MKVKIYTAIFTICVMLFSTFLMSSTHKLDDQNDPKYLEMWKKVDSLESKGLYNLALTEVNNIFDQASKHGHHNQVIMSVMYELKFNSYLKEDDYILGIARLEELIVKTPSPSKEILHSLLAEVYWGYYSGNSWKFSERTAVTEVDLKDIRTWDLKRLAVKVRWHYAMSLQNASISQSEKIEAFSQILNPGYLDNSIRPTLFDLLGHRAFDFFRSNTFNLPGPAETFVLDDPLYFQSTSSYLKSNAVTNDSLNTRFLAARVLYALSDFHKQKGNTKSSFYLELDRIEFAKTHSTISNKNELYYEALKRLTESYKTNDYSSEASYKMAVYHSELGGTYSHLGDTTKRWEKKTAFQICNRTIEQYPKAFGSNACASLLTSLQEKSLYLTTENIVIPNKESKFLLKYRNIDKVHLKVVKMDYKKVDNVRYSGKKLYKFLKKQTAVYSETVTLEDPKDFNEHGIELLLPEFSSGFYYLIASSDGTFDEESGGYALTSFFATNISYQSRKKTAKSQEVLVSDRLSGKPLVAASITVTYRKYNYRLGVYEKKNVGTFKTNEKGRITFPLKDEYQNYYLSIKHGGEVYAPESGIYGYPSYESEEDNIQTHLLTDRKMYRPGQTIYFKGIMMHNKGKDRTLKKNYTSYVSFYDVNGQEVKNVTVKTNEFGSYEGSFVAPFGVLTGQMRITDGYGSTSFRVEEYKRPKFNVEMKPIEGEFLVNDSIKATGFAKAFAGNVIDGADVKYRIVRSTQQSWGYWWGWYPQVQPKEISQGTLITDDAGEFEILFKAVPDKESNPKTLPIFNYTIYVDVTDINGETHSVSTNVLAGFQSLRLGNNLTADMNAQADFFLKVSTTNLNGQKIDAKGAVKIEQLKVPEQAYTTRLWNRPDMETWTASEFKSHFPNSVFKDENSHYTWPIEKAVYSAEFDTKITDSLSISDYNNWSPGVYRYEATGIDKNGIEVKDVSYFTVFNPDSKAVANNDVLWIKPMQLRAEPGETVTFLLGSIEENLLVNYDTEANGKLITSKSIVLNKEQKKLQFKITESYRGNFTVHFTTIRNNRPYAHSFTVVVPYTNKELDLSFSTFRNKLLPGAQEEWTLTVKNRAGKKEQAELLATLYDASLDELYTPNSFYMSIYKTFYGTKAWSAPNGIRANQGSNINYYWNSFRGAPYRSYATLNRFGWSPHYYGRGGWYADYDDMEVLEKVSSSRNGLGGLKRKNKESEELKDSAPMGDMSKAEPIEEIAMDEAIGNNEDNRRGEGSGAGAGIGDGKSRDGNVDLGEVKARSNFNETAFFYPQLTTDAEGNIAIKFTIPESLTKWRFLGLAHTEDLKIGTISEEVVTQKELMVVPNAPRFLREGDVITLSSKISNISEVDLQGKAQLTLYDPFSEDEISDLFELKDAQLNFTAEKGKSTTVSWTLKVPYTVSAVKYKIVAKAADFSDGEENVLPILSNRMLVTESLPLPIRGKEVKSFDFKKLSNSGGSTTLKHHSYTLEFTSNPAWYAIQAMPYMMEYPHECAEQTFTRYYSNAIATHVMNSNPKVREVIEKWGEDSPEAFLSNLQKNQELKAVILEETPWVLDAKNEEESKRNLAVLLDMERMSRELDKALGKTIKTQSINGGWPWFPGMRESRYITQHIVTGMGHLDHLGIKDIRDDRKVWNMVAKAVQYLDAQIIKDFEDAKKWDPDYLKNQHIGYNQVQYLYARSYFPKIGMNKKGTDAVAYYKKQAEQYWLTFNIYGEGMLALAAHRFVKTQDRSDPMYVLSTDIVKSLKDRSLQHEEFGMYWKDYTQGYHWYQAPVETQALMIEMFDEVVDDQASVGELKIWLLKQKQTTNWKTTKQTTEAVYALLLKGTDLLASDATVEIKVGGKAIEYVDSPDLDDPYQVKAQAGTGYFKTNWGADEVQPEMGKIEVSKSDEGIAWGAAYWQYFEDLDKITFAETNLKLKKDLFLVDISDQGEQLKPINTENVLEVGQKVRVRVELRTDRNLEYVHMKDMRASGFEPIDVLSYYRYREGLGYYQSTKDAATHFFFDYIPKGTYVFEYDLRVQHKGDFSNGITTIQCMYAPEFTSHSQGIRVTVE